MKKIFGVSFIAMLAIAPMMAMAEPATADPQSGAPTTENTPLYESKPANQNLDSSLATAGYVKDAYNDAITAVNTVYSTLDTAKADKSAIGTLTAGDHSTLSSGSVYSNLEALEGAIDSIGDTADSAIQGVQVNGVDLTPDANGAVNVTVAEGTANGTVAVNGTDVAVHGLGSAAYTASTAYDAAGAATGVQQAIEGKLDDGASGYDIDAKTLKVQGADVLTGSALNDYAKKTGVEETIKNTKVLLAVANNWTNDSGTTVELDVKAASVSYAEPQSGNNQQNGGGQQSGGTEQSGGGA